MSKAAFILVPLQALPSVGNPKNDTADSAVSAKQCQARFVLQQPQESGVGPALRAEIIDEVRSPHRIFNLQRPIVVVVSEGDFWSHECAELDVYGCGPSEAESFADFAMEFAITWDGLADELDENLTVDARELRDRFQSHVHDVEEVL